MLMEADTKQVYTSFNVMVFMRRVILPFFPQSELLDACKHGDFQAVQYLLQNGADPNRHDEVHPWHLLLHPSHCCITDITA